MSKVQHPAIILVGKTGSGKSTFANRLYNLSVDDDGKNEEVFKVGHGLTSETREASIKTISLEGKVYDLVDTPGFLDTSGTDVQTISEIARIIAHCTYGVQAILFVTEYGKMTPELRNSVSWVEKTFGPKVTTNLILVISKVNKEQTENRKSLEEFLLKDPLDTSNNPLKELLLKVGYRWVIAPHPDIFRSTENVYWQREVEILVAHVSSFQTPYFSETFKLYRKEVEKQIKAMRRKDEEDKAEIDKLQLLAKKSQGQPNEEHTLQVVKTQIAYIKENARTRELKSSKHLEYYAMGLGVLLVAGVASTVSATTAGVGVVLGLCLKVKSKEVTSAVAKLLPNYSSRFEDISKKMN